MRTTGDSHSEVEIPKTLARLRPRHPGIELRYAWPFDLEFMANQLADRLREWM